MDFDISDEQVEHVPEIKPAGTKESRWKTFNYSVGMFGTSIPINLLKTYAFAYYVDTHIGCDRGTVGLDYAHLRLHRCCG